MKIWKWTHSLNVSMLLLTVLMTGCTQNPLFTGGDILPGNSTISGTVGLGLDSPADVLVWLEGFDIACRTNADGEFEITLPVPAQQPNNGLTGAYKIYFYVANYRLETRDIVLLDGYVEDHKGSIAENGNLGEAVEMDKLLNIFTNPDPDKINRAYTGRISCMITLQATVDSVTVIAHVDIDELTAGFIVPADTTKEAIRYERAAVTPSVQIVTTDETLWEMIIEYSGALVGEGDYEIVPYIVILQPFLPPGLMAQLGPDAQEYNTGYLNIPCKRSGGGLHIEPGGDI